MLTKESMAAGVTTEDLKFFSGPGLRLAARIYQPSPTRTRGCGIVFCHGFGGTKEGTPPSLSNLLAQNGYSVLTFDYRGFGESEGKRGHMVQTEQVEDTVNAIEFFMEKTGIGSRNVGIYGTSFGGGIALLAARRSSRPRAAFVTVPVTSGDLWLRSMNRLYEYEHMKQRALHAMAKKTMTGEMEMAERFDLMVPDPHTRARHATTLHYTLETFYHISVYDALVEAHEIRIPVGIIGMKSDVLVPVEQATALYDRLAGPKQIYIFEHGDHHSVYDEYLSQVADAVIAWFDKYLDISAPDISLHALTAIRN